jgi:hypothetical protein
MQKTKSKMVGINLISVTQDRNEQFDQEAALIKMVVKTKTQQCDVHKNTL